MSVHGLIPVLLCFLPIWRILTPASSHPQSSRCHLVLKMALCNNMELSSVPATLPDDIEELHLDDNDIQTLKETCLSHYPSLNTLSIACNDLEKLESRTFEGLELLENLNLASNNLYIGYQEASRALKTLPRLRVLDLSENKLDGETVVALLQNLTSLEYLNLSGNLVQRLDEESFRDLHQLKELDLQRNVMFEIDGAFDSTPNLQRLNLAFNYLPCLTDFHMSQLVVLNASHNIIEWFISRQDLNETFLLETLDLSNNNLFFFPFLPSQSRLRYLYLSHNAVRFYERLASDTSLPNSSTTVEFYNLKVQTENVTAQLWDDSLHGDISSLEMLDLRENQVGYFPEGFFQKMPNLSRLRICTNCLERLNLTSERFPSSLFELDVSNNRLDQISADEGTLARLANLAYFNLSLNNLAELPVTLFSSLQSIRSVDVSYNNIDHCLPEEAGGDANSSTCVAWSNIDSLRQLYLKGSNLKTVPASFFTGLSLTHLELSDNPGLALRGSLDCLSGTLQHLGLANTRTQDFDFSRFQSLKSLNISKNSLQRLPPSIFKLALRALDLRDNGLSTIPSAQADVLALSLRTVFLSGNPFNCCQTEWFRTFEAAKTVDMVGRSDVECEDLFGTTHRVKHPESFLCSDEGGESVVWYIVLFVSGCLSVIIVLAFIQLAAKPKILQKSIKKKYLSIRLSDT